MSTPTSRRPSGSVARYSPFAPSPSPFRHVAQTELSLLSTLNDGSGRFVLAGKSLLQVVGPSETHITVECDLLARGLKVGVAEARGGHGACSSSLAAATAGGTVHIYSAAGGRPQQLHRLNGHTRAAHSVDWLLFTPTLVASGSQDGSVKVWDLRTPQRPVNHLAGLSDPVRCVRFSPHGANRLVAALELGVLRQYDLRAPSAPTRQCNAHTAPALCVEYHPAHNYVVSGSRDRHIQVWNMGDESREPEWDIGTHEAVSRVCWGPSEGDGIANATVANTFLSDSSVSFWLLRRRFIPRAVVTSHTAPVTGVCFAGSALWSCSKDKTLVMDDVAVAPSPLDTLNRQVAMFGPGELVVALDQDKWAFEAAPPMVERSSSTERPPLTRQGTRRSVRVGENYTPYVCHAEMPTPAAGYDVFGFLAREYAKLARPEEACQNNAAAAALAGKLRESQTWSVLGLAWELDSSDQQEVVVPVVAEPVVSNPGSYSSSGFTQGLPHLFGNEDRWDLLPPQNVAATSVLDTITALVPIPARRDSSVVATSYLPLPSSYPRSTAAETEAPQGVYRRNSTRGLAKVVSNRSELTRQLHEQMVEMEVIAETEYSSTTPWSFAPLLTKVLDHAAAEGNVAVCATLVLVWYLHYPGMCSRDQALEWTHLYIQLLHRRGLFPIAVDIIQASTFAEIQQLGQNDTAMRTFCPTCQDLVVNPVTKQWNATHPGDEREYAFWFCDRCNRLVVQCVYCHEAVKGIGVLLLACGHVGHFVCLEGWFVEEREPTCPAGCAV